MTPIEIALLAVLAVVLLLIIIVIARAIAFKPKKVDVGNIEKVEVDEKKILSNFTDMIKCETLTLWDFDDPTNQVEHEKFISLLQERYKKVFEKCTFQRVNKFGLVLKLAGETANDGTIIMSHYDVVPFTKERWSVEPFGAEIKDGKVFGRGTLDNKATLLCSMEALEKILTENPDFKPKNDLYLTFGGDEESNGNCQQAIVKKFEDEGVHARLVFDEGGAIVQNVFPGVKQETAVIGLSEKGVANIELIVDSTGGHASTPSKDNPVNVLARALTKLEKNPMKPYITSPVAGMLDSLGRHSSFGLKLVFANMWLFNGLVKKLFTKLSTETNAMLTTTFAYTTLSGSMAHNVLPSRAVANLNIRISNNHSVEMVKKHLQDVIADDRVKLNVVFAYEPSPIADPKGYAYNTVKDVLHETYPEVLVSPYVMLAASDSRFYRTISDGTLKFAPFKMTKQQRGAIHGDDENIDIENLVRGTEFYVRLMKRV